MLRRAWTRRDFLTASAGVGALLAATTAPAGQWLAGLLARTATRAGTSLAELKRRAPKARFWISTKTAAKVSDCLGCHQPDELSGEAKHDHETTTAKCQLCARNCMIGDGERGMCRARINLGGELRSLVYGRPITVHVDPIEKKPFYHFLPGSSAFSLATSGCPLRCKFCQNWEISQARPEDYDSPYISPEKVVGSAVQRRAPVIAFTYNEPTVFTEYLTDIARAGREQKCRSVLVSCGFMNEAPLDEMCEVLDAIKIDLKGYSKNFYRDVCGAELQPVLRSIKQVAKSGVHLELVNLVVPTLNDSPKMLRELSKWVVGEIGSDVPVHFTRFHPDYQLLNLPPTPVEALERARETALEAGVHYAFLGNVPGHPGNNTYCPKCGEVVVARHGFFVRAVKLKHGACAACGQKIAGVWS
jgi:pyruvate formate lyase activating enzyme